MTDRFEPVRDVFRELIDSGRESGAGLSIWHDGTWYAPGLDYSLAFVTRGLGDHDRMDELWHATVRCLSSH